MKKTFAALTAVLLMVPLMAKAQSPGVDISGELSFVSNYKFRGISQTNNKPAIQGGFELAHPSGLYAGTWGSNVSDWTNANGNGMELDLYAGYSTELPMGLGIDLGAIRYQYPGNAPLAPLPKQNTTEFYVGVSYGIVSYTFSRTTTNWFGFDNGDGTGSTKGSYYQDLSLEYPLNDQITLSAHYGRQKVAGKDGYTPFSFSDYSVGLSYALPNDFSLGLTYVGASLKDAQKAPADPELFVGGGKQLYKSAAVISLTKTF
jgi:uncharacterized protein (TIGR02001 family)